MFKGIVILAIVGGLFAYFVFNFVGQIEGDDAATQFSADSKKAKEFAKYYKKDAAGYPILALGETPIAKAREVWKESPVMKKVLDLFPKFEQMREEINIQVDESPFRQYLLKKLDDVQSQYLGGVIDSDKAKEMLQNL